MALEKYNRLAPLQNPPCPVLNYSKIVGYGSLGEFLVLKHSHHDILTKPWIVSANCKMATKYFKLVQSHKEIVQLNVEIKHLQSWVEHEDRTMLEIIDSLLADDPDSSLIAELKTLYAKRHCEHLSTDHMVIAPNGDRDDEGSMNGPEDDAMNEEAMRLEDLMLHYL
ncbi:hypothetical protein BD769DRAFT_1666986 [Suillus cothurnatus]|nr:hypothetical protein BD769DRAFT_1666986 [Suillus cothurnatus]